jgi:RNA polymerase sigma-70 factor (ECF subfamily)
VKDPTPVRTHVNVGPVPDERQVRFSALAGRVAEPLRRYVARRSDAETAQDVVADALLVAWRRLDEIPADAELPWCYAVARRCLANAERSARRQRSLIARIGVIDVPRAAPAVDANLPDPAVHRALAQLSGDDREALRLSAWEDLSPAEIAVVMGVTANAVSIRLHRARRRLAELLVDDPRKNAEPSGQKPVVEGRAP